MINGNIDVFLDTGWYSETTLFYNGHVYWLEGYVEKGTATFIVKKYKAEITEDYLYHTYIDNRCEPIEYDIIYNNTAPSMDQLKKDFFEAEIFENKTFWQVQDKIVWAEPGKPIKSEAQN